MTNILSWAFLNFYFELGFGFMEKKIVLSLSFFSFIKGNGLICFLQGA